MSMQIADNFSYQGTKPLDARVKFATVADMVAVADSSLYDGCMAYVTATKLYYTYDSTNTVDATFGKWREYKSGDTIQLEELPTASEDEEGNIYQYIGESTVTLTHGYFYECVSDDTTTPTTYSWEQKNIQPGGATDLTQREVEQIKNSFTVNTWEKPVPMTASDVADIKAAFIIDGI